MPTDILPRQTDADAPDLLDFALEHVARVRARCPQFESVDTDVFIAVILEHLRPLDPDRAWLRRRRLAGRDEPVWIENYGLHLPAPRGPA